jgi:hypothetical protein
VSCFLLLAVASCSSDRDSDSPEVGPLYIDSTDVHVVGTSDVLAVVQDLEVLPDGRIWVLNSLPPFFIGFGPNGALLGTHGEAGGGPEEFRLPAGFVVGAPGGEAWVLDSRRHGLVRVSRPDEPWSEVRLPRTDLPPGTVQGGLDLMSPVVRTARLGDEIVLPHSTGTLESGVFSMVEAMLKADLMRLDPATGAVRRVLSIGGSLEDPFSGFTPTEGGFPLWKRLWAVCGGYLRVYDRVRNQLRGFDRNGSELEPLDLPPTGLAEVSPQEFARVVFPLRQAEVTGGVGDRLRSEDSLRLVGQMAREVRGTAAQLAAYLPPFVDFRCSPSGTMWLRPIDTAGGGLAGGRAWLRVDADGGSRMIMLPPHFDAFRFFEDRVFGVLRDDLDIPSVAWAQLPGGGRMRVPGKAAV